MSRRLSDRQALAGLFLFALAALLPGSASPSQVTRGDVYTYVLRVVVGFLERGDWLVPHMGGGADFTKPPLFHWILAASIRLLPNPFLAIRLPAILCSAGTALITFAFGRRLGLDSERSLGASFAWLGSSAMLAYGRQPLLEAPLALAMLAAFYSLVRACSDESPAWLFAFGAALGLSSMIKWIVGPLTIGFFTLFYLGFSGRWRWLAARPALALGAVGLAAAVALPWPLYALVTHGDAFLHQLRYDLFHDRYSQYTPLTEFLGRGALLALAPWTLLLVPAALDARKSEPEVRSALGAWLAAVFVPCLLITARTSRYAFPAVPALSLWIFAAYREDRTYWTAAVKATAVVLVLANGAGLALCARLGLLSYPLLVLGIGLTGAAAVLAWRLRLAASAAAACLVSTLLAGPAVAALGMNAIPSRVLDRIGTRPVSRFVNDPQSASTGYLQLYLRRDVDIIVESQLQGAYERGSLVVVSGTDLDRLKAACDRSGLKLEALDSWESAHTNPLPDSMREAMRSGSMAPLEVRHSLVELKK